MSSHVLRLALASAALLSGAHSQLTLTLLDATATPRGGRCADGTMAGFYIHEGTDPSLFVIFMEGGGACYDEVTCTKRSHMHLGSSKNWTKTKPGSYTYDSDCSSNPDFCNATHAYVAYCTGDAHAGNNTEPSSESWGLYFDGHANFAAIVSELQQKHGLNSAERVLLSGTSAGGIGVFKNVDYLASRLPHAVVKGAPDAGWFFPAALPSDLPNVYSPSDWAHFSVGQHGNQQTAANGTQVNEFVHGTLWQERGLYPAACVADQKPDQWWACGTVDKLYKYIQSSIFVLEAQFDTDQIFQQMGAPEAPTNPMLFHYIEMYGEAMRNSTAQVLTNAPLTKKPQPDGIFHPSCLSHAVGKGAIALNGTQSLPILGDWFFERNEMLPHRLVEHCPPSSEGMPCNPDPRCQHGIAPPGPGPPPGPSPPAAGCVAQLVKDGCDPEQGGQKCGACATQHQPDLEKAGCTEAFVTDYCEGKVPPPAPSGGCDAALDSLCPVAVDPVPGQCDRCAETHLLALTKAGCDPEEVRQLCRARKKKKKKPAQGGGGGGGGGALPPTLR
jgi:ribosome maturation protein SDO1